MNTLGRCAICNVMKLTSEQVERICELILSSLKDKKLIEIKTEEKDVLKKMIEVFLSDLKAEEELDKEVESIMSSHSSEIDSQRLDYRKMFNMIKGKLARERGIIL